MTYEIIPFGYLCDLEKFTINGIKADYEDFGIKEDLGNHADNNWWCSNMQFIQYDNPDANVLKKYGITNDEFVIIAHKLKMALSFGSCNFCY